MKFPCDVLWKRNISGRRTNESHISCLFIVLLRLFELEICVIENACMKIAFKAAFVFRLQFCMINDRHDEYRREPTNTMNALYSVSDFGSGTHGLVVSGICFAILKCVSSAHRKSKNHSFI